MTRETDAGAATLNALKDNLPELISALEAPVALFDCDMRYVLVSDGWRRTLGLEGHPLTRHYHYNVNPCLPETYREAHRRGLVGEATTSEASQTVLPDGTKTWEIWAVTPPSGQDGSVC
jgi:PAS domain-containing protein